MRRGLKNIIAILLAVLTIGTAFGDARSIGFAKIDDEDLVLELLRSTVVPEFNDTELTKLHYHTYPQLVREKDALVRFSERLNQNGTVAKETIAPLLSRMYFSGTLEVRNELRLDWKMIGTLLFTYQKRITDVLRRNLSYTVSEENDTRVIVLSFAPFDELLWLDNEMEWFAARNTYYYLNTVYGDDGELRPMMSYNMPQEKLDRLTFPLDEIWFTRIKTTWFRSRDGGTRKHTGMDIRCSHGSPIYACAGGVVNSVGYHVKGGYYVSIVDDDGFEYFYYHMKKDSQCVVRGQRVETGEPIGLSGNTGNSAAPHLHLSVITPDRRFIDPFTIYYRWVYQHSGLLVKKPS